MLNFVSKVAAGLASWLFVLAIAGSAQAESGRIEGIVVNGAQRVATESVLSRIALKNGEVYDAARGDAAIRALYATGQYKDVKITRSGGVLTITLVENPTVSAVTFTGNTTLKSDKLKEVVQLKAGGVFSDARAHADGHAIRELYRREGRLSTTVTPRIAPKDGGKVDVTYEVGEGQVDKVADIVFEGNKAFTSKQLESVIRTARSSWLDILKSNSIYVPERIADDREMLRRHYMTHGYAEAAIVSGEGVLDASGKSYTVKFVIDEGARFTFSDVRIDAALSGLDLAALNGVIVAQPGGVYNAEQIDKSVEALSFALWESNKRFARVLPQVKRDHAKGTASVTFRIEEGPHVIVERIDIIGNTKTQAQVIRREMKLSEGEAFNGYIMDRDRARLKRLGFFKNVEMKSKPGSDPEKAIVDVEVVEDQTMEVSFGGGYSTSEGVIGDVAFEDHNVFGTGRSAKIKLAGSLVKLQADLGVNDPHFLGSNVMAGFDLFYKDIDRSVQSSYKSQRIGGDVHLGYALSDTVTGSVNYTFAQNKIYDVGAAASPAIKEAAGFPDTASSTYYTSSVGYSLAYDTRNSRKLPTSGSNFVLSQDFAGLGGDVRYIKSSVDARTYFTVGDSVTLVGRATAGNIMGWGGQDVRLLDMYFMGSDQVRGFASAGIGPRDTLSTNQDALGGKNYITTTAEARFGLPLVPDEIGLRGAVFADAGSLFGTSSSVSKLPGVAGQSATLRASVGAGLIWDSPIGALRADYAIPLASQPFDKTQPWSFGLASF